MGLTLTPRAARELRRILNDKNKPDSTVIRLGIKGGGCSGFEYRMDFAEAAGDDDVVSQSEGLRLAVDPKSARFVDGTEIDFQDDILKRAFVFNNPQATKTCGCGTSFRV